MAEMAEEQRFYGSFGVSEVHAWSSVAIVIDAFSVAVIGASFSPVCVHSRVPFSSWCAPLQLGLA